MKEDSRPPLAIPPLVSGGVMLSYRCSNECRHCLYRCSPRQPDEWMTIETAEQVFDALSREKRLHGIHIAGGEPFLRPQLLEEVVCLAVKMGIPVDYVETNAFWAADQVKTKDALERLREAGLTALLVSASMFHNEFVPFERTRNCAEAAARVFGAQNVIVYLPQIYELLRQMPADRTHTLDEFCRLVGLPPRSKSLPRLYGLIPGGRVPEALREYYDAHPAESFRACSCRDQLLSVTHFHIDHRGDLFTSCCAGLAAANAGDLHPHISRETHPVFTTLCESGPWGLMGKAKDRLGFRPKEDGYISKCDLCLDARRCLYASGRFPELRPAGFYEV